MQDATGRNTSYIEFQIQYFLQRKGTLTKEDRAKLDAAIHVYEIYSKTG